MAGDDPYVTRDGAFEYRRVRDPAVVICFHEPVDRLLRDLDARYVEDAWAAARAVLERHGVNADGFSRGCAHPGQISWFGHSHVDAPVLTGFGWNATEEAIGAFQLYDEGDRRHTLLEPWPAIVSDLNTTTPPLCLACDHHRAQRITGVGGAPIRNEDGATLIESIRVDASDDTTGWWVLRDGNRSSITLADPLPPEHRGLVEAWERAQSRGSDGRPSEPPP